MNIYMTKLNTFCRKIDKAELGLRVRYEDEPVVAPEPTQAPVARAVKTYRIMKSFNGEIKQVGFGLTLDQADQFIRMCPQKIKRTENSSDGTAFEKPELKIEEECHG